MTKNRQIKKQLGINKKDKWTKTKKKIDQIIASVDHYLAMHGGSVQLVDITDDGIARIEFVGACVGCSAAETTMDFVLKESILTSVPEINDVEAINMVTPDHAPPGIRI